MDELNQEIDHARSICRAAGCIQGLVTEEECMKRREDMKPSIYWEIVKVALPVVIPIITILMVFAKVEAKVDILMKMVKFPGIGG